MVGSLKFCVVALGDITGRILMMGGILGKSENISNLKYLCLK